MMLVSGWKDSLCEDDIVVWLSDFLSLSCAMYSLWSKCKQIEIYKSPFRIPFSNLKNISQKKVPDKVHIKVPNKVLIRIILKYLSNLPIYSSTGNPMLSTSSNNYNTYTESLIDSFSPYWFSSNAVCFILVITWVI